MKMNKKLFSAITSALLFTSASVHAEPYMTAQAGLSAIGFNNYVENIFENSPGISGRMGVGYLWDMTDNLKGGVEGGLHLNQKYKESDYSFEAAFRRYSIDFLGVLDFHFDNKVNVFAKAGVAWVNDELKVSEPGLFVFESARRMVPKLMLGVGYDLNENINVNITASHEYYRPDWDSFYEILPGLSAVMLGVTYRFA